MYMLLSKQRTSEAKGVGGRILIHCRRESKLASTVGISVQTPQTTKPRTSVRSSHSPSPCSQKNQSQIPTEILTYSSLLWHRSHHQITELT